MPSTTSCHTCGKVLTYTEHGGLCGACLFQSLLTGKDPMKTDGPSPGIWQVPGYELGAEIGRGGSAVVYRAKQYDPERTVALKILLPIWTDGTGVRERFRLEAQALAQLDHPGILPVLSSGEIDGVPWYSMPLASGGTLAERRTTVRGQYRQIAEWLAGAAEAVAHAHARGVLHRDLKPGNLLFAEDGRLFVSDFGLARVLATSSNVTMTAAMLGTPAYMAPEVIANGIRAATVTADVWGLGAILYELLAGRRPFEAESIPELVRSVAGDEPPPLRAVPSDLAAIAFRALHKNPERRYPAILAMAADLRAWLAGEPVTARPYPWWERLEFSIKRHPWAASGITVVILLSIATAAIGVREARLRREEQAARLAADQEAATSREILRFLQNDLLAQASPESEPDRNIKLRTVLDRAAKTIDGRFPQQPLVEAAIRETLARTYLALGNEEIGFNQAKKAIALYLQEKGPEAPEILRLRHFEAYDDVMKGKLAEAEKLSLGVLAVQRRVLPVSNGDIYATWEDLVQINNQWGKWTQAEKIAREALTAAIDNLGADHVQTIKLKYTLAIALAQQERGPESEAVFRQCLETAQRTLGKENDFTLKIMSELAIGLGEMGRDSDSLALLRELLEIRTRVLGTKHSDTALTMLNLATILGNLGRMQEAEVLFEQARETYIQLFGPEDRRTLRLETNLINNWFHLGRYREAVALGEKNIALHERLLGPEHPDTLLLNVRVAQAYSGLGEFEHVIALTQQYVEVSKRLHGVGSDFTMVLKLILANAHRDRGHYETAESLYHEINAVAATASGDAATVAVQAARFEAQLVILRGQFEQGEDSIRRALDAHQKQFGPSQDITLLCEMDLVGLLLRRTASAEAEKRLREIVAIRERDAGLDARPTLSALDALGVALAQRSRWSEAEVILRRSGEHWSALEPGGWREATSRLCLGWVLYSTGRQAEATRLFDESYPSVANSAKFSPGERMLLSAAVTQIIDAYRKAGDIKGSAKWQAITVL